MAVELLASTRVRIADLVPPGSSLERETWLAAWNGPMGRVEHQSLAGLHALGFGGLVGASRATVLPSRASVKVFGVAVSFGLAVPLP